MAKMGEPKRGGKQECQFSGPNSNGRAKGHANNGKRKN
jgi:hypothetical protein